jgi:glutamate/tyrosine decarboxylase-like PLP-dependent enzyme
MIPPDDVELDQPTLLRLGEEVLRLFVDDVFGPAARTVDFVEPAAIANQLVAEPPEEGLGPEALLDALKVFLRHGRNFRHPRHFGHQKPAPLAASSLAAFLADERNNGGAIYEGSPYAVVLERHVVDWLARMAGFPAQAAGSFVNSGSEANLTALLCARDAARRGRGGRKVLVGEDAHYSVARAIHIIGLGEDAVVRIPVDVHGCMRLDALTAALDTVGSDAMAIVATAGTTSVGAIDPLPAIAALAAERGLWLHVDAAHAGSLLLSARLRPLLEGLERADSLTWNPHKMMWVGAPCSLVLLRNRRDLTLAMAPGLADASYVVRHPDKVVANVDAMPDDPVQWNLATSRPLYALKVYANLVVYGMAGLRRRIERCCDLTQACYRHLLSSDDFEPLGEPRLNLLCFRHRPARLRGDEPALDAHNVRVREHLTHGPYAAISGTRWGGHYWLRAVVMSPEVDEASFAEVLEAIRASL